jgi:putative peptidoglycan lipid II flippase
LAFTLGMGIAGLALAFSFSSFAQLITLYLVLRRRITITFEKELIISLVTYLLLTLVMGASIQIVKTIVGSTTDLTQAVNVLYQGAAGIGVGIIVYIGLALLLRLEEVELLWKKKKIFTTN